MAETPSQYSSTVDFLQVRELAHQPSIPQLQTRWYSSLSVDFMSIRRSSAQTVQPNSARPFFRKDEESQLSFQVNEEDAGTFIVGSDEIGRRALRPRPSWDPNDPLNWNGWQKYKAYLTICLFTFLATANATKFTIPSPQLGVEFKATTLDIKFLTAFNLLALGAGNIFWIPLSRVLGKRFVTLLALPFLIGSNIWSSQTHQYTQIFASTILSGFGSSAALGIGPAIVADIFYIHERAIAMMLFQASLSSGLFLGTLINNLVIQYFSWRENCYWIAIAAGVTWVLSIYTLQETSYYERDLLKPIHGYGPKKNHWQRMELIGDSNQGQNFCRAVRNLVVVGVYPGVFWGAVTVCVFAGWNFLLRLSLFQTFSSPDQNHSTQFLALISLSPLLGSLMAILPFGKGVDVLSTHLTRKHEGRREPEYRLYLLPIPIILGGVGIVLTGLTLHSSSPGSEWIAPVIGWGIHSFATTGLQNMVFVYVIDSYTEFVGEVSALVAVMSGGAQSVVVLWGEEWVDVMGSKRVWGIMVGVQCFVALFGILFLVWGKNIRVWSGRWGPLRWERTLRPGE